MTRVVIAGCGYVGNELGRALLEDGFEVFGIRRDPTQLAAGIRPVVGDMTRPESLGAPPDDVELLAYTAAADGGDEAAYRRAYLDGLRGVLRWLDDAGSRPRRALFTSSTAVYGQASGEVVDEDSATAPRSFRGEVQLEAERLLAELDGETVALRLGGIYGPGRTRLIELVRSGRARRRPGPHFGNRIHRDDAALAIRHLLRVESPAAVYLGVDTESADEAQVYDWLADRLGMPRPAARDPGAAPPARDVGSKRCSSARLQRSGYTFRYPTFREGFAALL